MGYLEWKQATKEHNIRACRLCTALIADSRAYGRMPNKYDSTLCECCDGAPTVDAHLDTDSILEID